MPSINPEAKDVKIGVIGAGSMTFISSIVRDLALMKSLHGATLALMD